MWFGRWILAFSQDRKVRTTVVEGALAQARGSAQAEPVRATETSQSSVWVKRSSLLDMTSDFGRASWQSSPLRAPNLTLMVLLPIMAIKCAH